MPDVSDMDLLWNYDRQGSEETFAELVRRHINLVYSAALRHVGIAAHAEEITQAVFVILAQKAASLRPDTILDAWLYETTRLTSLSFLRGERRRQLREQEAYMQSIFQESHDAPVWNQLAPLLDEAMSRLGKKDREAVLLRFFKDKSLNEVAVALKTTEAAAQSRVHRAVQKLQKFFIKRGIDSTTAAITGAISANSVQAAPVALAKSVTAVVIAKGTAVSCSTLTLIKGALKIMAWTKTQSAIVACAVVLLAAGTTTTVVVKEVQNREDAKWDTGVVNTSLLDKAPHIVKIIPTRFPDPSRGSAWAGSGTRMLGVKAQVPDIIQAAYNIRQTRMILSAPFLEARYDFIANQPPHSVAALEQLIEKQFGVVARTETIQTNILFLRVKQPNAAGLKQARNRNGTSTADGLGDYHLTGGTMNNVADYAENVLGIPVINQTGLKGRFDIDLKWDQKDWQNPNANNLKQAITDQLGLELVPGTAPVDFLIVEKAK